LQLVLFHNLFFSLNLTLHFLLSCPTWLFFLFGLLSSLVQSSELANLDSPTVKSPTWYILPSQQWLLLFQYVSIFSQYSNSFHSAIILLSINFIIIFLIFFFLLFFYFCFLFVVFILFSYFSIFIFIFLIYVYFKLYNFSFNYY
jgi:hypothetical protein